MTTRKVARSASSLDKRCAGDFANRQLHHAAGHDRIIRVTDPEANARGEWAGALDDEAALRGLRDMMTVRALDARMVIAQRQGKTSFYMQCLGEEAVACAFQRAL